MKKLFSSSEFGSNILHRQHKDRICTTISNQVMPKVGSDHNLAFTYKRPLITMYTCKGQRSCFCHTAYALLFNCRLVLLNLTWWEGTNCYRNRMSVFSGNRCFSSYTHSGSMLHSQTIRLSF